MESTQLGDTRTAVDDEMLLALERLDQEVRSLQAALLSNRRIGVAVGIVMCELRVTETAAFEALRRVSMDTNRKLRDVAEDVIDTGALTGAVSDDAPSRSPASALSTPDRHHARSPKP